MKVVNWIDPCDKSPSPTPRDGRPADYMIYLHCSDLPQAEKDRLWTRLMFKAWHPGVENKMGYAHYYNEVPQGELEKFPIA